MSQSSSSICFVSPGEFFSPYMGPSFETLSQVNRLMQVTCSWVWWGVRGCSCMLGGGESSDILVNVLLVALFICSFLRSLWSKWIPRYEVVRSSRPKARTETPVASTFEVTLWKNWLQRTSLNNAAQGSDCSEVRWNYGGCVAPSYYESSCLCFEKLQDITVVTLSM
jgi:hypothetical protein